eukprot:2121734-Rhodomonas_salina.5
MTPHADLANGGLLAMSCAGSAFYGVLCDLRYWPACYAISGAILAYDTGALGTRCSGSDLAFEDPARGLIRWDARD